MQNAMLCIMHAKQLSPQGDVNVQRLLLHYYISDSGGFNGAPPSID